MLTLYHIASSPFAEKARWALDFKGLDWESKLLLPGRHADVVERIAGTRTVPVLVDSGAESPLTDSTDILQYLERIAPQPALFPADEKLAARVLEIEDWFDENGARPIARFHYSFISEHPAAFAAYFTNGLPRRQWLGAQLMRPFLPRMLARFRSERGLNREAAREYRSEVLGICDRLEGLVDSARGDYLVGEAFSAADLTATCMLSMGLRLEGSPWAMTRSEQRAYPGGREPDEVGALRATLAARPAGQWATRMWRRHR